MITYSFAIAVNDIPYRMMEGVGGFGGSGEKEGGGGGGLTSPTCRQASIVVNSNGELWGYEDYELGDLWIPEEAGKGRSLKLPGGDDDDWEEGRGDLIFSEYALAFLRNPPELLRRFVVVVGLTVLDIVVTKGAIPSLPGWSPLVVEMKHLEKSDADGCSMPWETGIRVFIEPVFTYGSIGVMMGCVVGRAGLLLILSDGGGLLLPLGLSLLPALLCNLAALTLFGRKPCPLAHTSFLSSLFGVGVQRALGALVYRRPKEGCRPIGVISQVIALGVLLACISIVIVGLLVVDGPAISSVPVKAILAAIVFGSSCGAAFLRLPKKATFASSGRLSPRKREQEKEKRKIARKRLIRLRYVRAWACTWLFLVGVVLLLMFFKLFEPPCDWM